jgi:hypothetical protein
MTCIPPKLTRLSDLTFFIAGLSPIRHARGSLKECLFVFMNNSG